MRMGAALRLLLASALGLVLAGMLLPSDPPPAQAQAPLNQVTVHPLQQVVYEGGLAQFSVRRAGGTVSTQTVYVKTWETEHDDDPVHGNLTEQVHAVTFPRLSRDVTLNVAVYNDERSVREGDLRAEVQASPDNEYNVGSPSLAAIEVLSYYDDTSSPVVNIEVFHSLITEGNGQDVQFDIRRTRDTSQDTTVLLRIDDPGREAPGQPLGTRRPSCPPRWWCRPARPWRR